MPTIAVGVMYDNGLFVAWTFIEAGWNDGRPKINDAKCLYLELETSFYTIAYNIKVLINPCSSSLCRNSEHFKVENIVWCNKISVNKSQMTIIFSARLVVRSPLTKHSAAGAFDNFYNTVSPVYYTSTVS